MSNYFLDKTGVLHQFDAHKQPEFKEVQNSEWVYWGVDQEYKNKQPLYYDWLYNSSSKHRAIINRKNLFINGKGFNVKRKGIEQNYVEIDAFAFQLNDSELLNKISLNELKYGGFCYEVVPSKSGKKITPHYINFGNIRRSKREYDSSGRLKDPIYAYTCNWNLNPEKNDDFTIFHPFKWGEEPMDKNKRYIVYYSSDDEELYPLPEYTAAVPYIAADFEVGNFVYNNTKNGFSAGWFVEFYNGEPSEEEKGKVVKYWKETLHGSDNGGEPAVSFQDSMDSQTKLTPLQPNGQDDRYVNLNKQIREEIYSGHTINPIVVGLKGETGFSNNADELRTAIEEFQSYYIDSKQLMYERHFNAIRAFNGIKGELYIQRLDPIQVQFSESILSTILTEDEMREMIGREPKTPQQKTTIVREFSKEEQDEQIANYLLNCGIDLNELEIIETKELFAKSIEDAEEQAYKFHVEKFGIKETLIKLLSAFGLNSKLLAKLLGIKEDEVEEQVSELIEDGRIEEDGTPIEQPQEVFTVYSYEKRNDVSGSDIIPTTRPFCRNLVRLSRFTRWTIDDIKGMNNNMGLDVFSSRGGWYTIPDTDIHTPYCRHVWKTHLVRRRNGN